MRQLLKYLLIGSLLVLFTLPAQAQGESIAPGDTVEGTLTADQPSQTYTLDAEAGQAVNISLSSDDFDAYLSLLDDHDNVLAENDDNSGTDSAILSFVLPQASSYSILVESYGQHNNGGAETGAFTLSVTEQQVSRIEYSQVVNDELTTSETSKDYVFTGQEGDVIIITESSDAFDSYLYLLDSNGSQLMTNDDSGGSLNSAIGPYTLPATGSYTIRASSLNGDTPGSFTLTLNKTEVAPISYGDSVELSLTPSDQAMYFTFEGTSGDMVSVSADSDGTIDTSLTLNDPYNSQIVTDEDSGSGFDPEIYQQVLSTSGTYTIVLQAVNPGTGKVTLTLKNTPPPSLDEGVQTVSFSDSQYTRAVTFTAQAGETVRLNLHTLNDGTGSPSITVTQGGNTIASASGSTISDLNVGFVTPEDGDVSVQITDYSYSNLSYEVSLAHASE
ncbi:MAG: PPC domain-containing protein [Anaerolineae bacterium]